LEGYILPLLFFKRISDAWDEETEEGAGWSKAQWLFNHNVSSGQINIKPEATLI